MPDVVYTPGDVVASLSALIERLDALNRLEALDHIRAQLARSCHENLALAK
jgi:hypothetical protein